LYADSKSFEKVPDDKVAEIYDRYVANGFRPSFMKGFIDGGKLYFDLVFETDDGKLAVESARNFSHDDYRLKDKELTGLGYTKVCGNAYEVGGKRYYVAIWSKAR